MPLSPPPEVLGRFWRMPAQVHGQTWNAAEPARSMGVSATAVNHYRDLLAGAFMIRVLPPWFENCCVRPDHGTSWSAGSTT